VIPAHVRAQIELALGKDVLRIAEEIHFHLSSYQKAPASLWRELLQALHQHPDLMETPLGMVFTFAVLGRMNNANGGASEPSRGGGFPGHRRQ
jgi:hypothetical protein